MAAGPVPPHPPKSLAFHLCLDLSVSSAQSAGSESGGGGWGVVCFGRVWRERRRMRFSEVNTLGFFSSETLNAQHRPFLTAG